MCGVFGIILREKSNWSPKQFRKAAEELFLLSESRGRDAAGMAVHAGESVSVLRRGGSARQMIRDPLFSSALENAFRAPGAHLGLIGHCRLATNGSMAIEENNQPIMTGELVGVHNGIVTNSIALLNDQEELPWAESDTKALFARLGEHLEKEGQLPPALAKTYSEISGSASIAAFQPARQTLTLASNTGSLFFLHNEKSGVLAFASERSILEKFRRRVRFARSLGAIPPIQLKAGQALITDFDLRDLQPFELKAAGEKEAPAKKHPYVLQNLRPNLHELRRCTRCVLPHTYPYIRFDSEGVCNFCRRYPKQEPHGEEALLRYLEKFRSKDGSPDCLVGLSGGRDSSYGLHMLKTCFGMNPIAYTFDWGLTTDTSRRNQAKICSKLGIEHIVRSPDIQKKRAYIRKNVRAFLRRPHLGMVPIFMAGDKDFYQLGRKLRRDNQLPLTVFCCGHSLEQRDFMTGFCGLDEDIRNNKRLYEFSLSGKARLAAFYSMQFLRNPAYLNASFFESIRSFAYSFLLKDDFLYLYEYLPWDEAQIEKTLREEYDWEADARYGRNQWRMGDGQTAFTNYIYHSVAGFSEFDNFRSNQIREGMISREDALNLIARDNEPKWGPLLSFSQAVGINLDETLRAINNIPKLY
ncbi:MAG TPA: hypothetical protein VIH99_02700 [Bdellovibrionota bacterium]|jgi:asparagine synthetase B (glutamine-hydrolysing)